VDLPAIINAEIRMTNEEGMMKLGMARNGSESYTCSGFVIRISFVIRHSCFVIDADPGVLQPHVPSHQLVES